MINKLPLSAIVVGYNESRVLTSCFNSIKFCSEIIYVDLNSSDSSIDIAKSFGATIYILDRKNIPSCEFAQAQLIDYTQNDWILIIDPDELVDIQLEKQLCELYYRLSMLPNLGVINVPWQFYYGKHKLNGTIWGGINQKVLIFHKDRFEVKKIVHYGRSLRQGFSSHEIMINKDSANVLHHFWVDGISAFWKKHFRYLKYEANDQFSLGKIIGYKEFFLTPFHEFYLSFILKKGYKDGFIGFYLSIFWAVYKFFIAVKLLKLRLAKS